MTARSLAGRCLVVGLCGAVPGLHAANDPVWWLAAPAGAIYFAWIGERRAAAVFAASFLIAFARSFVEFLPSADGVERFIGTGSGELSGYVASEPAPIGRYVAFELSVASFARAGGSFEPASGRVRIRLAPGRRPPPEPGSRILIRGQLEPPNSIRDAADPEREQRALPGIRAQLRSKSPAAWSVVPAEGDWSGSWEGVATRTRSAFERGLAASFGSNHDDAVLVTGIVLGRRDQLAPSVYEDFRVTGASHILAASGANVAILSMPLLWLFPKLRIRRKPAGVVLLVVLFVYTLASGASPSIVRAFVVAAIWIASHLFERDPDTPTALSLAALLILWITPSALWEPGFQLSFAVTAGFVAFSPAIKALSFRNPEQPVRQRHRLRDFLGDAVKTSAFAWLMAAPILAQQFGQLPLYGIPANAILALIVVVMLPLGLVVGLLGAMGLTAVSSLGATVLAALASALEGVTAAFARLPYASITVPAPGWTVVVTLFAVYGLLAVRLRLRMPERERG